VHCAERAIEQQVDVVSGYRRGRDADERERRIAAADIRIVLEVLSERCLLRLFVERRSGIGDGNEVAAGLRRSDLLADLLVEVCVEGVGFGGRPALAGDDEERLADVDSLFELLDLLRTLRI
jgi:hypothetical protein